MSIKLMSLIWDDHSGELTGIEKAVLLRMADFAADNGTQIFPSIKRICLDTGFKETAVKAAIKSLERKQRIKKTNRSTKQIHITNLYRINVNTLEKAAEPRAKLKAQKKLYTKPVNKPVDKPCITREGGSPHDPGVGRQTTGGGSPDDSYPPPNHHIKSSIAKDATSFLKNEQRSKESQFHENKKKLFQDLEMLTARMKR